MSDPEVSPSPEPSLRADERTTLVEFLDWYRTTLVRKGAGLDPAALAARLGPSTLTIGRLIRHMTLVEDHWFHTTFAGRDQPEPWASAPWEADRDWEMTTADGMEFEALRGDFEAACERSRAALVDIDDLDTMAEADDHGRHVSLRWILVHMIEEYARHCGHADLIRESIDGRTGD